MKLEEYPIMRVYEVNVHSKHVVNNIFIYNILYRRRPIELNLQRRVREIDTCNSLFTLHELAVSQIDNFLFLTEFIQTGMVASFYRSEFTIDLMNDIVLSFHFCIKNRNLDFVCLYNFV